MKFEQLDMDLLQAVADIKGIPSGAVNIRRNGEPFSGILLPT